MLTTPLLPDDYADLIDPLASRTQLRARLVSVLPETPDSVTLVLRPSRGWRTHIPGQYLRLGVDVDGVRQWRAYSLTSDPTRRDGLISVTVKAIPDGKVSTYLVRSARPGVLLHLAPAGGEFVLPTPAPERLLFLTAGSGITPVMGMLRSLGAGSDVVLVHSAPSARDVIFAVELQQMAAAGRIRLVQRHTDTDGKLDPADLEVLVPDWAQRQTWACGPIGLLDAAELHWEQADLARNLHVERFRPAVLVADGEGGEVTFTAAGVSVESDGSTPLLDVGEKAGVLMPSGCRMGICFGCVVPLRSGVVRDLRNGDLTTANEGDGVLIQTCVSASAGACQIDL